MAVARRRLQEVVSRLLGLLLGAAVVLGCSADAPKPERATPQPASAPSATQEPATPVLELELEPVKLYVDDTLMATVTASEIAKRPRLEDLLPEGPAAAAWTKLSSRASGRRRQTISNPLKRFGDKAIGLFPHAETGTAAVGMFVRAPDDRTTPDKVLDGVFEIRISTKVPVDRVAAKSLTVVVAGKSTVVAADDRPFAKLKVVDPPLRDEKRKKGSSGSDGWALADVVALYVDDIGKVASVTLTTAQDETVDVPGASLRSTDDVLWFKRNRAGMFRFKWFRLTPEPQELTNARAVVRIDVTLTPGS